MEPGVTGMKRAKSGMKMRLLVEVGNIIESQEKNEPLFTADNAEYADKTAKRPKL